MDLRKPCRSLSASSEARCPVDPNKAELFADGFRSCWISLGSICIDIWQGRPAMYYSITLTRDMSVVVYQFPSVSFSYQIWTAWTRVFMSMDTDGRNVMICRCWQDQLGELGQYTACKYTACMHVLPSGIECGIEFCFILLWEMLRNVKTYQDTRCIMSMIPGGSGPTCNEIIFPVLHWSTLHYTQDFPGNPRTSKVQLSMAHLLGTLDRLDSLVLCLYPFTSYIASIHVFFWPKRECEKHPKIWWLLRQPCESTQKKWCHLTRKMFFGWHNWIETHMDSWYPIGSSSCCSGPNHRSVAMLLFLLLPCRC